MAELIENFLQEIYDNLIKKENNNNNNIHNQDHLPFPYSRIEYLNYFSLFLPSANSIIVMKNCVKDVYEGPVIPIISEGLLIFYIILSFILYIILSFILCIILSFMFIFLYYIFLKKFYNLCVKKRMEL